MTGSRRWMAPEVYLCAPYGFSADVFSFGLLLWNICSLKVPFGKKLTCESHHERVIVKRERPKRLCSKLISSSLMNLMECCWSVNRSKRPSFEEICTLLRFEIISLRDNIESSRAPGSPPIVTPGTSTLDRSKDKAAEEALKNATPTATSVDPGNGNDNISGEEVAMPSLGRTTTNETVRRSNANTPSCCANKGSKKDFFGRLFVGKKGEDSRKKFQNSKFDAVNTSCHIRGRHKQAQIRNRHNGNSLKNRASRLFIPHSSVSRRSSLEQRSVYLMEKSDLSLEDLQISSGNINFSMHHLQNIPSQESPRVFEDLPGSSP